MLRCNIVIDVSLKSAGRHSKDLPVYHNPVQTGGGYHSTYGRSTLRLRIDRPRKRVAFSIAFQEDQRAARCPDIVNFEFLSRNAGRPNILEIIFVCSLDLQIKYRCHEACLKLLPLQRLPIPPHRHQTRLLFQGQSLSAIRLTREPFRSYEVRGISTNN